MLVPHRTCMTFLCCRTHLRLIFYSTCLPLHTKTAELPLWCFYVQQSSFLISVTSLQYDKKNDLQSQNEIVLHLNKNFRIRKTQSLEYNPQLCYEVNWTLIVCLIYSNNIKENIKRTFKITSTLSLSIL